MINPHGSKELNPLFVYDPVENEKLQKEHVKVMKQMEKILLELEVSKNMNLREVFEAKNLAKVVSYTNNRIEMTLSSRRLSL